MKTFVVAAGLLGGCVGVGFADEVSIQLSDMSSDSTPAGLLDAIFTFNLTGTVLTFTVENTTDTNPGGEEYEIRQAFWNAPDTVSLTATTIPTDWVYDTDEIADGFGTFDFKLSTMSETNFLAAGDSLIFVFTATGATSASDFITELSRAPPPNNFKNAAAKFQAGPEDDSAFGGGGVLVVIPLPTAAFLAFGGLGAIGLRRRR